VGAPFNPFRLFTGIFIPEALVCNPNISAGAKLAYGRLARYAGESGDCYPSVKSLAHEIGVKERQAQRYLAELSVNGFIRIVARFKAPNIRDTNGYVFLWHETFSNSIRKYAPVSNVTPSLVPEKTPRPVSDLTPKESHGEESQRNESHSSSTELYSSSAPPPPLPPPPEDREQQMSSK